MLLKMTYFQFKILMIMMLMMIAVMRIIRIIKNINATNLLAIKSNSRKTNKNIIHKTIVTETTNTCCTSTSVQARNTCENFLNETKQIFYRLYQGFLVLIEGIQ